MKPSPLAAAPPWDLVADAYAQEVAPVFEQFAGDAIRMAGLRRRSNVVDVASGPGTLALLTAREGHRVSAIDFSANMIANLTERAARAKLDVDARVGDGMALPYADASFDAGFSMFGLMFFPDRAKGLRELRRVVKPGGRVVISSWPPLDRVPHFSAAIGAFAELRPPPPGTPPILPALADPAACVSELREAGFRDVETKEVVHPAQYASTAALWASFERSSAPLALAKSQLGAAWEPIAKTILERLRARFGDGPQTSELPALITVGTG
jgi:SAM-dependent methyltransferase